jgi:hypothetical protein
LVQIGPVVLDQTMVECSLGGHLSELCPTTPTANQDGHHY